VKPDRAAHRKEQRDDGSLVQWRRVDDIALALNRIYAFMLIMVISAGAGPYSLDAVILGLIDKDVV
jgi:hypothetical protein